MNNSSSLYRKYRPSNFNDLAGHFNVVEIIKKQLANNSLGHAFLFTGQRGTGKTSVARILAKAINCKNLILSNPCEQCESCQSCNKNKSPDIFEIDAASNNGVEEIRNIKMNVSTLPILGKYKVYIIDEVHMLTKSAFNALLKTLEEPPTHAIFILATTEYAKIPATILSRCQILNFKKIDKESLEKRLEFVVNQEGSSIPKDVLQEIYYLSEGSLRDALNIVEQLLLVSDRSITIESLKKIFAIASKQEKITIIKNILEGKTNAIISYFETANKQGMEFDVLALSLIEIIKEIIEVKLTNNKIHLETLTNEEFDIFANAKLVDLFRIADNLSQAYANTKNSTISFNYILISLLKSIAHNELEPTLGESSYSEIVKTVKNTSITSRPKQVDKAEEYIENMKKELKEPTKAIVVKEEIIEEVVLALKDNQSEIALDQQMPYVKEVEQTNSLEDEKEETIVVTKYVEPSKVEELDSYDLLNLKNSQVSKHTINVGIPSSTSEVINILVGANKEARFEIEEKIFNIFKFNDNNFIADVELAKRFIALFKAKIVAVSTQEILLNYSTSNEVNFIKERMLNYGFRTELFTILGKEYVIHAVNKIGWEDVKVEFMREKKHNELPKYSESNPQEYYLNSNQELLNENMIGRAATLFDLEDVKIGE